MVLPLVGGLLGAGLAGTGALGGAAALLSPVAAGAIGSGLGSFAQTGDLETGVKTGLASYLGGQALGAAFGGAGGAAAEGATQAATSAAPTAATSAAPTAVGESVKQAIPLGGRGALGNASGNLVDVGAASFTPTGAEKALTGLPAIARGGTSFLGTAPGIGSAIGASLVPQFSQDGMDFDEEDEDIDLSAVPDDSNVSFPTGPLSSMEYDYGFGRNYAQGGYLGNFYRPSMMGQAVQMQEGGIVALAAQDAMMDSMGDMDPMGDMDSMGDMGGMDEMPNEKEVIMDAVDAIQDPEPDEEDQVALAVFVSTFGEDALKDLVESVDRGDFEDMSEMNEGMIQGPGDAMDDLVPATNQSNGEDILLSGEEFIVPGDVVSGLGNGSSSAGADELYEMMDRVREARTGTVEQPPKIKAGGMLPA